MSKIKSNLKPFSIINSHHTFNQMNSLTFPSPLYNLWYFDEETSHEDWTTKVVSVWNSQNYHVSRLMEDAMIKF